MDNSGLVIFFLSPILTASFCVFVCESMITIEFFP